MIKQYFIQALATLRDNPPVSFLTILGTALAVAMMMVLVLVFQVKTSSFSPVSERYRMMYAGEVRGVNEKGSGYAGTGMGVRFIKECFYSLTTPEAVTAMSTGTSKRHTTVPGNKLVRDCDVRMTDAAFWKVFDFKFLQGSPYSEESFASALPVVVICEQVAREFFGTVEVAGQTIQLDYVDYRIQGVVRSVSEAVSEAYGEVWIPYSLNKRLMEGGFTEGIGGDLVVCLLARSPEDFDAIRQEVQNRVATYNAGTKEYDANIWKQPITSIQRMFYYVRGDRMSGVFTGMLMLAALFLFLPVFNLLGIMYSQIQKRSPEFGLRKAFGATVRDIMGQIVAENLIITFLGSMLGFCLSILFFYIAKDSLLERPDVELQLSMIFKPGLFAATLFICVLINLFSAGFPAWKTSKAEVVEALNTNT